jgi:CHAT domain-containing protein/tetratricopeptide (TPR) repeat protein
MRRRSLALLPLAGWLLLSPAVPGRAEEQGDLLLPGPPRELPIAAGEEHVYRVEVGEEPVLVLVEQQGIDLAVEAPGSTGQETLTAGAPNKRWGPEVLLLPAGAAVERIEVRPAQKSGPPGRYTIQAAALPAGTEEDAKRLAAFAAMSRAGRLAAGPAAPSEALSAYREALSMWRAMGDRRWEAEAALDVAELAYQAADLRAAVADFRQSLALWRELSEPRRVAAILTELSFACQRSGEIADGRAAAEEAFALWQSEGEAFEENEARNALCLLDLTAGALPPALSCFEEILAFYREHGDVSGEASALNSLGGVYDQMGEPDAALDHYGKALALWQSLGNRIDEARTLKNIGPVHRALGEWQEALRVYGQAREILAEASDPIQEATLRNVVGYTYNSLGEPERALPFLEESLKLRRKNGELRGEIQTLNSLGTTWRELGDLDKALASFRQALEKSVALGDSRQVALSHLGLGQVQCERGEAAAALRELDPALAHFRETGMRAREAQALQVRGRALALAGRPREALSMLQEVLERQQALRDRAGEAETLDALAKVERSLGLLDEARGHAEQAIARVEELRTGFVSPDLRAAFLATRRRAYELAIDLRMDQQIREPKGGYDRAAFAMSEQARARTLIDVLQPGSGSRGGSAAPAALLARRQSLRHRLSAKASQRVTLQGGLAKSEALERDMGSLLTELDSVEAEIRRQDPRYAAFSEPPSIDPGEIAGLLDPGTLLLEYSLGEERSFLWAVSAAGLRSFVLPPRKKIEDLARRVFARLSTVEAGAGAAREKDAEALSRILLKPVWKEMAGVPRLVLVPHAALPALPFSALPVPRPGRGWSTRNLKPLLEHCEVVYLPSATTLALQRRRLENRPPAAKWAAVLADPVFTRDDPRLGGPSKAVRTAAVRDPQRGGDAIRLLPSFERLPASRREAEAITALAPAGQVLQAFDLAASRDAVLSGELHDYRVVHFATHGIADTRNPELSGLVLSLVDAAGKPRDGFLGLSDIYDLDLAADLVVLSGCRTGLGKEVRGEGLMGLTRGFLYAGVPRVVGSLWPVQDRTTAELMSRFYKAMWQKGLPPAAALRAAQRSLRSSRDPRYRNPHSWAGFVLQGDWR